MQSQLQRIEIEDAVLGNHDLAVDDASRRQALEKRIVQLRKISIERLEITALNVDVVRAAEDDGAKAIPLGLEQQAGGAWNGVDELRQHRFNRRVQHDRSPRRFNTTVRSYRTCVLNRRAEPCPEPSS